MCARSARRGLWRAAPRPWWAAPRPWLPSSAQQPAFAAWTPHSTSPTISQKKRSAIGVLECGLYYAPPSYLPCCTTTHTPLNVTPTSASLSRRTRRGLLGAAAEAVTAQTWRVHAHPWPSAAACSPARLAQAPGRVTVCGGLQAARCLAGCGRETALRCGRGHVASRLSVVRRALARRPLTAGPPSVPPRGRSAASRRPR